MPEAPKPIPLAFWQSATGCEPVRQFGWRVGLPVCRPLSGGLWEVRSSLPSRREARVLFGFHEGVLIALHAIFKKTQKTPAEDLKLARQGLEEIQSWSGKIRE
jgi:phage-related protein